MKNTKRFASIATAALVAACMAVPMASSLPASAAATPGQITFTGATVGTHAYTAYQIFKGDPAGNGFNPETNNIKLDNPDWAISDADAVNFLNALKADARFNTTTPGANEGDPAKTTNDFTGCDTAAGVAQVLANYSHDSVKAKAFADFVVEQSATITFPSTTDQNGTITLADNGYYVIKETALTPDNEGNGAMTAYLLGVYDASVGAEVTVKSGLPTFQKKIKDVNDSGTEDGSTNGSWLDSADYDIDDVVPFQLTATLPDDYANYKGYQLVFHDDLQAEVFTLNSDSIKVYTKSGASDAVEITISNANAFETVTSGFTDADSNFKSTKTDGTTDFTVTFANLKDETKGIAGLKAGDQIIIEYTAKLTDKAKTGTPGNWNSAYLEYSNNPNVAGGGDLSHTPEDLVAAFTFKLDVSKVDGNNAALPGAGFTLYKYSTTANDYVAVKTIAPTEDAKPTEFSFTGIDAGKYKLVETTVPNGYTKAEDVEFIVNATHDQDATVPTLTGLTVKDKENTTDLTVTELSDGKFKVDLDAGELATKLVNTSGALLPSTGGIGTTIFYVAGGVLVVGAGVTLITKKRMSKKEEA